MFDSDKEVMGFIGKRKTNLFQNETVLAQDLRRRSTQGLERALRIRPHPRLPDLLTRPLAGQLEAKLRR